MKVLFVSQELPPETGWGGIGTYVDIISQAIGEKGSEVHVLSVVGGQKPSTKVVGSVTVHRRALPRVRASERLPPESRRRLWLAANVARLIPRLGFEPTVVECPEWMAEGFVLSFQQRWPLVVRLHSSARQLFPYTGQGGEWHGLDGRLAARLEEVTIRRANVVASAGANLAEMAPRLRLDERALRVISYPMALPSLRPMPHPDSPRVTFLGRFEARKGPEVLLRAAPRVLAAVPGARFAFVGRDATEPGTPSSAAWLRREAERLGVAEAVEVREQFGREAVLRELERTTVCAAPSRWESFGYVVAEAQAVGRPVVVSSIPPFRDLVEDGVTGRIAPDESGEAWAGALIDLLRNQQRAAEMGQAGAARITAISDPGHLADLTLEAYRHAIDRWREGRRAAAD